MDKSKYIKPREYEMMAILLPDQSEEETAAAVETVLGYITEQNGAIDSVNADSPWGRRRLAYTIRHEGVDYRDGHYVLVYFTALPSALSEIERELKLDTNVIRYLLLTHDPEMGEKIDESAMIEAEVEESEAATEEAEAAETEEVPVEEAPVEANEAPAEEAPAEAEEVPAEEAAAEEAETADDEANKVEEPAEK